MARGTAQPKGNLPVPVTRFVGRRRELSDVRRRLQDARLVTLTGVGGVGKTRLAVEVGHAVRRAFPGGVWMVDLSGVVDPVQVPQAVANALGIVDRSARAPAEKVAAHLADAETLLVLDNCEQVVDACAAFVDALLTGTQHVRVLATSRRTLGVTGEHLVPVPPLAVPGEGFDSGAAVVGQVEAVQLLVDRAAALQPGFAITERNWLSAARLCARLDGLPLAIELAAIRLRSLSLEQLVDRLEGRFALLTGGSRTSGPRQQTLRAVMDWSHSLCSPEERLLWARLSVFAGGFDLDAAEGVCAGAGLERAAVLDVLDRLVAQSIVVAEPRQDGVRFRLLETIREYGWERLGELGERAEVRRWHRDYHLRLAESLAARWVGPHQEAGLARLRAEHANLRAALESALSEAEAALSEAVAALSEAVAAVDGAAAGAPARHESLRVGLRLAVALRHLWYADAYLGEGRGWLDRALAVPAPAEGDPGAGAGTAARMDALWVAAWVSLLQGDENAATSRLGECEQLATRLGDHRAAGFVASLRATAQLFAGRLSASICLFEQALETFERAGDTEGVLWAMFQLAIALSHRGESERAQAICTQSLALSERTGDRLCRSYALWVLAFDTWRRGESALATRLAREGLHLQRAFNDPVGAGLIIELLSWIAAADDPEGAARLLATADSVWELVGTTLAAFGPPLQVHRDACEQRVREALGDSGARARARVRGPRGAGVGAAIASVLDGPDTSSAGAPVRRRAGSGRSAREGGPGGGAGPLSAREEQIAALLAQGLSNRAIAAELVISQRTVDGHVERILAKLGFSTRAQVAAWVAARDAAGSPG